MLLGMSDANPKMFLAMEEMARRAGIPVAWLRREVQAGRIPCLKIGRKLLFNPTLVEQALLDLATATEPKREVAARA